MGARLAWNNLLTVPGVVISSSSEATGYVDDNLSDGARWKVWRSGTSTGDQWVKFDRGSAGSFQAMAAINAVIHAGGTLRVQANATDTWATPTLDVMLTVPSPDLTRVLVAWLVSPLSLRWFRFYFTNTGAVNTYVELGAVFAGTYLEPARSISAALSLRRVDPSVHRYATGGQRSSVLRSKYHEVSGTFVLQTATARNTLRAMYETTGSTLPALFAVDPLNPSLIFYGTLANTLSAQHQGPDLWDMPIDFTEDVA